MGSRPVIIRFCDKCQKELIGRLTLHTCPCCGKDICVSCQTREDNKHKPRERKPKVELVSTPLAEQIISPIEQLPQPKNRERKAKTTPLDKPDISTFTVKSGVGDEPHTLTLEYTGISCLTLREGAMELMAVFGIDQKYIENAPASEGKKNLLNILKEN